jgi:cation diffusion facilitator CzcD-associated flavoprotein CzcO
LGLVVGAGIGGLAAARELRKRGLEVVVLERASRVGGVWRDNTYPGAACDVPSSLYSYSFQPHPGWPRRYAEQPDILQYVVDTSRETGLDSRIHTGMEVTTARYDETDRRWHVTAVDAQGAPSTWNPAVVVFAVGQLSRPHMPHLPGIESFAGPAFHSARWDHDVELRGQRVAVVGTGASAIQFVPELQQVASGVTVFQRSAPYVVPKPDRAYTRAHLRAFQRFPATQGLGRELTRFLSERLNHALGDDTAFTKAFVASFRLHLWHQVRDKALRRRLLPDYPIGCKRLLFSNDWYPALTQPNVGLVTERIAEVCPEGLRTADGRLHEADVIVYGTGFLATQFLEPVEVVGRDGRDLHQQWADGARAFLGITVPNFPNVFVIYGPNTNLGGSSIISMIECQTGYLGQAVARLVSGDAGAIEVRKDVAERYDKEMQERLAHSVWARGCTSWYQTPSGRITTNWPGTVQEYRERTALFDATDYRETRIPSLTG